MTMVGKRMTGRARRRHGSGRCPGGPPSRETVVRTDARQERPARIPWGATRRRAARGARARATR